jgi:hypothetical protein
MRHSGGIVNSGIVESAVNAKPSFFRVFFWKDAEKCCDSTKIR